MSGPSGISPRTTLSPTLTPKSTPDVDTTAPATETRSATPLTSIEGSSSIDVLETGTIGVRPTSTSRTDPGPTIPDPTDLARERAATARFRAEMPIHAQGAENSCGTTSLAMALAYLGVPGDFAVIDRSIRFYNPGAGVGTAPGDMVRFARGQGVQAQQYNDASVADLEGHVRAGRPVTVLINYQPEGSSGGDGMAHYVNVIGFHRDASGRITDVVIVNPWGQEETLTYEHFMSQWSNVTLTRQGVGALLPTYHRTMVVLDRPENPPLPASGGTSSLRAATTNTMMSGVSGFSASVDTVRRGHVAAGVGQMVGSTLNTVVGGAGFVVGNLIGQNLERGGDALVDTGMRMLEGGFFEKIGGFLALLAGGTLKALGFLFAMAGGAIAEAGRLAATPFNAPAQILTRRDETREMLLNPHRSSGVEDPAVVLGRASTPTKVRLLDNLLEGAGSPSNDDQRAALVVLQSAAGNPAELRALAAPFGGPEQLLARFSGAPATEVARLYGLPAPAVTSRGTNPGTVAPLPAPA